MLRLRLAQGESAYHTSMYHLKIFQGNRVVTLLNI